jgi:general secretion pathway protein K
MVTRSRQAGIALLMVMVIVALATLLAVELVRQQQLQVRRGANLLHGDQAFEYALGGEVWAKRLLVKDAEDSEHDSLDEFWNRGLPPTPIPGGTIGGRLRDLQGHFNLNNLYLGTTPNALARERFSRLLAEQGLPAEITEAAGDWLDADSQVLAIGGAEDDYYSRLPDPYRAANRPMADVTELRLLRGVTDEAYAALAPLVIALPEQTAININTAPSRVLQSLGLSAAEARIVIDARESEPFETLKQFTDLPVIDAAVKDGRVDVGNLTISSRFFELETEVRIGELYFVQYSLLLRNGSKSVAVIARRRRGW